MGSISIRNIGSSYYHRHHRLFSIPNNPLRSKNIHFPFYPPSSYSSHSSALHTHSTTTTTTDKDSGGEDFTWDDVVHNDHSYTCPHTEKNILVGFFDKVSRCNRNSDKQSEFIPFLVEGHIVGHVHNGFAIHLQKYKNVFTLVEDTNFGSHVALHPMLISSEDRTEAVGKVIKSLGEKLIPGFRNELYPVISSFGQPAFFSLERAAAPYFGIKAYGVHMNGYVERDGEKYLWIAKRSKVKSTYPGKLDHLVAGGLPHGISCSENLVKECEEEAGIPRSISSTARAAAAVSYMDIDGYRFKRDVLFCYDLKLPESFIPANKDGEVESFKLVPVTQVANIIRSTTFFKENCNLVITDFLIRHGYIKPDDFGYLKLLKSLRSGDCT